MVNAILRRFELMSLSNSELPSGYKRLEFIKNTSAAYIDTGVKPNSTLSIEAKGYTPVSATLFRTPVEFDSMGFNVGLGVDAYTFIAGRYFELRRTHAYGYRVFHLKFGNYYIKDLDTGNIASGTTYDDSNIGSKSYNIYISMNVRSDTPNFSLYLFKIWDNGKLIRDFIPARRLSDNKVGMYDKVEGKFYASANDGYEFKGSDETVTLEYDDEEETTNDELIDGYTVLPDGTTYHKTTE